jgi:hypothetical protein
MKKFGITGLRLIALFVAFTVLFALATSSTTPPELAQRLTPAQLSRSAAMLPVVSLLMSLTLGYLALRSRWHGWKLAAALFVVFYGIYTFLSQIETMVFPAVSSQLPEGALSGFFIAGLLLAIPFSLLAVWILGRTRADPLEGQLNDRLKMSASEWAWKLAAAAVLYVAVYFTFGYYVAWRTPGLPEFYGGTDPGSYFGQLANVMRDTPWLPFFQLGRGLMWTAIGCILLRMHKGPAWEAALATGLAFSILMAAPLLLPNPLLPPAIARAHAIELLSSNLLYGVLLSVLLLWRPANQPSP